MPWTQPRKPNCRLSTKSPTPTQSSPSPPKWMRRMLNAGVAVSPVACAGSWNLSNNSLVRLTPWCHRTRILQRWSGEASNSLSLYGLCSRLVEQADVLRDRQQIRLLLRQNISMVYEPAPLLPAILGVRGSLSKLGQVAGCTLQLLCYSHSVLQASNGSIP